MLLGTICTTCGGTVTRSQRERCPGCGEPVHDSCAEFARTFECRTSDERWIGTVEF